MTDQISQQIAEAVRSDFAGLGKNSSVGDVDHKLAAFTGQPIPYLVPDLRPLDRLASDLADEHGLSSTTAWKLASLASWLFVMRPVGCAIRAGIPHVVTALRSILDDKRTLWVLEMRYYDEDKPAQKVKRHAALRELVGGKPVPRLPDSKGTDEDWTEGRDDGTVILAPTSRVPGPDSAVYAAFRTAQLTPANADRITKLALAASDWKPENLETVAVALRIRSEGFAALGGRVAKTEVPDGGFEANPQLSAPKLVAKVAATRKIAPASAALYLQMLALPDPTKANVLAWNAWSAKDYQAASAELLAKKLVIEGKVPKAGRTIFLPGACSKLTKVNLPIEAWKLPFYLHGRYFKHVVGEPCHMLFARAWDRAEGDDAPRR